ncbi:uncharacterized protein PGTG_03579 [Puccinia graminis f. sp. tritici CRL 75-36-700-3]|uniref:Uncharacterized protein n=1 Tax=Puccinia graminis f. sp. tritici (strain CRL 75-36-700-3 / race SCCL) TaxID=418459 RepID=E3JZZ8_PUCGT|nr:uncharacterized protein PGTG_03579 [Puccinia graminis f. sp. tritici CRL 75-36-700-3]EFP77623.1 hypothetical protein PGTG_03579 [Puccinia graminis f. sp. tritici CRL 75-36-700-3]
MLGGLLTKQFILIVPKDVLKALLGEPIYDKTDLDGHGHMAVPPYVPPEAACALKNEPSFLLPSPDYDAKSSLYLSVGYEKRLRLSCLTGSHPKKMPHHSRSSTSRARKSIELCRKL